MKRTALVFFMAFNMLFSAFSQKKSNSDNLSIISKRFTYNTLSSYQKSLFEDFIALDFPEGSSLDATLNDRASLRNITRLAEALLFRNKNNDKENAIAILRWILKYQYTDPKSENYGMWRTNVAKDRLDQNWREFIGCDLIIIYHHYKNILPKDLLKELETGLVHAAKGAMKRNVTPYYTNISIMSAFLMEYVGNAFGIEELKISGLKKANAIFDLFNSHQTFSEYNSPTYYGVTLIGIALWRELAYSAEMKSMGRKLEQALWNETATLYNPNLKNIVGPFFRAYGMDMQKYNAIFGLWIAIALDNEKLAPMPGKNGKKNGEMSNIAPILHLGLALPETDLAALKSFKSSHYVSKTVPNTYLGDTLKKVTSIIYKDWMMGGLWGNRRNWEQIKLGTIHWKTADEGISWLLVPSNGKTNVKVSQTKMSIYSSDASAKQIEILVDSKHNSIADFNDKLWQLQGMSLTIDTNLKRSITENLKDDPSIIRVVYDIPASWNLEQPLIEITPKK